MSFTGSPGTGKTTVAVKMADILFRLGYIKKGHLITVTRDDLVGQYIGHTAPKTKEVLKQAMGGVLFIDEAYYLYKPDNERDYGSEAIELLLQVMENQRDDLILIFAGGKTKIDGFFNSNPGISSRIGNHVDFKNYESDDLIEITKFLLLNENRFKFTPDTVNILVHYIDQLKTFPAFANARTLKVFVNQLLAFQAIRVEETLMKNGSIDYDSLVTIKPEDFNYFTGDDFINIIGSEEIELFKG
jgi:probable Rubsico expression protein CbbX